MMQEIINNMVKHSGAGSVSILIKTTGNFCTLVCHDSGAGFDPEEKLRSGGGAGLVNLRNRARMINAVLSIQSSPGNGTTVTIELPL
jgi:signal transduction histidine kinase